MSLLITPQQLNSRLKDPGTIVLDATLPPVGVTPPVDTRARYLAKHIPGAAFFDIDELSDHTTPLPHMLPNEREFAKAVSFLGVGSDMTVVIYEQEGVFSAPRAWWMLKTFGAEDVVILDGGLKAWEEAGYATHSGFVTCKPARFTPRFDAEAVISFDELQQAIAAGETILDARAKGRFDGTAPEPRPISSGHMPGSINIPFLELTENGRFKSTHDLKALFETKGVDRKKPIITSCGSGVTAAVLAFGLEMIGAKHVSLYDGSWCEYAQHPEAQIEKAQ